MANQKIEIDVAKKIWAIADISPEHGDAVMDVIGEDGYKNVMKLQAANPDSEPTAE